MFSRTALRSIAIAAIVSVSQVNASCQSFELDYISYDITSSFSIIDPVFLANFTCPYNSSTKCEFSNSLEYNVVAERSVNVSVTPDVESDIFNAAYEAIMSSDTYARIAEMVQPLLAYNTTLYLTDEDWGISSSLLDTEPGKIKSLQWQPFNYYISGVINGCDNSTIDGTSLSLTAPQYNGSNNPTIFGTYQTVESNITNATEPTSTSPPATSANSTDTPNKNNARRGELGGGLVMVAVLAICASLL